MKRKKTVKRVRALRPTAKQSIEAKMSEHTAPEQPLDTRTTEGLQRTLAAHWDAIKALAAHIDGTVEPIRPTA